MKVVATLVITKKYFSDEEVKQTVLDIETYITHVEKLIIYNLSGYEITAIINKLSKYNNFEEIKGRNLGQVYNYNNALSLCYKNNADYGIIMELGYFYEEGDILILKRYAIQNPETCVITPNPVLTCEEPKRMDIDSREIMGCHLIGALINVEQYKERGFVEKYYQTTFDYEYCLYHRSLGRKVMLMVNAVLRNSNYRIVEKRFLFWVTTVYDKDIMDVYYEARNKQILWADYELIDPIFVKLDKKEYKAEIRELKYKDKGYAEKSLMINRGKADYLKGIVGRKQEY